MGRAYEFIANTAEGVFVVDRRQRIVLWNDAARNLLGHEADEAIGRNCYDLLGGTDETHCPLCKQGCAMIRGASHGETVPTRDVRVSTKTGKHLWVSVATVAFPPGRRNEPLLAHMIRDATQRRDLEGSFEQLVRQIGKWESNGAETRSLADLPPTQPLTTRELEVLRLLASGASTDKIAARLSVATATVRTHVQRILEKLGSHSRLEAVVVGQRSGLI